MNYFIIGGDQKEYGPASVEQIREWIKQGRANGDTLLRAEGETDWKPLRSFAEFAADVQTSTMPPPLPREPRIQKPMQSAIPSAPVRINYSFARAWHLCGEHFGTVFGACLLVWMAFTALLFIPYIGAHIARILMGPLLGSLFLVFLKLIREEEVTAGDVFVLGREQTFPLIMVGLVSGILTEIAVCFCLLPAIYLQIAWFFAVPLVADRGLHFWEALEQSRRAITPRWFHFFGLFILAFLPVLVFTIYMLVRVVMDLHPILQNAADTLGNPPNLAALPALLQTIEPEAAKVMQGYAPWILMRQLLLLISLPLGIGSFAFVYEDFFGRKRQNN